MVTSEDTQTLLSFVGNTWDGCEDTTSTSFPFPLSSQVGGARASRKGVEESKDGRLMCKLE